MHYSLDLCKNHETKKFLLLWPQFYYHKIDDDNIMAKSLYLHNDQLSSITEQMKLIALNDILCVKNAMKLSFQLWAVRR